MNANLLLVDDDLALAESVRDVLQGRNYTVTLAHNGKEALTLVEGNQFDVKLPVIIMTAFGSMDRAIEATKRGAFDFLLKPFKMPHLLEVVSEAVASGRGQPARLTNLRAGRDLIIGKSGSMQDVFKEIGRVASKPVPVMILGETGTGKELVARAIHLHSDRAGGPFIAVNCAAIPDTLVESELFGHERGSFTHAVTQRIGRFEEASGGTIFLDEIGDLPAQTQVKLLRVIEQQSVRRVGGTSEIPINVRVLSATHRDLHTMVRDGSFREDLYFRLNTASIRLPPLRDRADDIPLLVGHFLHTYGEDFELPLPSIDDNALAHLIGYSWPGNVRQLENVIKKALIDSRGVVITESIVVNATQPQRPFVITENAGALPLADLVARRLEAASQGEPGSVADTLVQDVERELYTQAIELTHGNQSRMATLLGVSRMTIREKLDRFELLPRRGS